MSAIDATGLLELLPRQRWFGAKDRQATAIEVLDLASLDARSGAALALVRVSFAVGASGIYHLPVELGDGDTIVLLEDVSPLRTLGEKMARGASEPGRLGTGTFHFAGPGLDPLHPPGSEGVREVGAEQSNTSIVLDDWVILKLFRRPAVGENPDVELSRILTSEGFEHIPEHLGDVTFEGEIDGEEVHIDLGLAQRFIPGAREGWRAMLDSLHGFLDTVPDRAPEDLAASVEERAAAELDDLERLGEVTGALHVLLGREEQEPEIAPEPIDSTDLKSLAEGIRDSLHRLARSGAEELAPLQDEIEARLDRLSAIDDGGLKLRVHGDYHLGQVIHTPRGWMILDFEGEPARTLEERRARQSPLKDVAGMLRSLGYAATATLFERTSPDSDDWARLEPWVLTWEELARDRFLTSYLRASHEGRFLPPDRDDVDSLLDAFEIEKALYEIGYELSHRPDWVRIPNRGIAQVVERGAAP